MNWRESMRKAERQKKKEEERKKQFDTNEKQGGKKQLEGIGSEVYLIWFRSPENQQMMKG